MYPVGGLVKHLARCQSFKSPNPLQVEQPGIFRILLQAEQVKSRIYQHVLIQIWKCLCVVATLSLAGLEPAIFGSEDQRLIH